MNKYLKITLIISLAVNLIMLGVFLGHAGKREWGHKPGTKSEHFNTGGSIQNMIQALPDDKQGIYKAEFKALRLENKQRHKKLKALRNDIALLTMQEPFNSKAFMEKTAEIRKIRDNIETRHTQLMAKLLSSMSAEARAELISRMLFRAKRHGRH